MKSPSPNVAPPGPGVWACILFLISWLTAPSLLAHGAQQTPAAGAFRADRLLVKPNPGASNKELAAFHGKNHCEVIRHFEFLGGLQVLRVAGSESVPQLVDRYRSSPLIQYAEPDYQVRLDTTFPDDPSFLDGTLWGLNNVGQSNGVANADIDAPEAWTGACSASNVLVAIVDSGIRYTHEDLSTNIWTSPNDGSHGINVVSGTNDPNDDNGHGSHLAGIIGAQGSNGVGVVGVAWRVQLMACKFVGQSGNGSIADAITALEYARTNGAQVVNASWGLDLFSESLSNAMAELHDAGILVVAAAGNDARDIDAVPHYPACFDFDNILSVMATTRTDEIYPLSNIGQTNVDLAAPGSEIYSTDFLSDNSYAFDEGTSMSTAYASGAAALLRAAHPAESPAQIIARILAGVDPVPGLSNACVSGGRLNLRKALGVAVSVPVLKASTSGGPFVLTLSGDPGRNYIVETSTDLSQWSPTMTNLTGLTGCFELTNTTPTDVERQFYRALLAP